MQRVYDILMSARPQGRLGRAINLGLLAVIALSVTASVLETDTALAARAPRLLAWVEWVSIAVFTVEYALRLWCCVLDPHFARPVLGRLRFALTPMALVDLVAIAPFYLELYWPGTIDLRFLRTLRLLRLLRLLRSERASHAFTTLTRVLQGKRPDLIISLVVVVVAMFVSAGAIYVAEHGQPGTTFTSIPQAMWWSVETITTIGYGDMVPTSATGKVIGALVGLLGICAVALPVGIVTGGFFEEIGRSKSEAQPSQASCPHCGKSLDR